MKIYKNSQEYKEELIQKNPNNWNLIHNAMNKINFFTKEYETKLIEYMKGLGNQQQEINNIIKWRSFRGSPIIRVLE